MPGALDRVISAGVTVESRQPLFGSLRVRHFGPRPPRSFRVGLQLSF